MVLSRVMSGVLVVGSVLASATAWAAEDDCVKYSYDTGSKSGHIFEKIPTYNDSADKRTIAYIGYTTTSTGSWLAMCLVDKNGNEHFDTLHFEDSNGQEGAPVPARATLPKSGGGTETVPGHLEWDVSICGTSQVNKLFGAYVFNETKTGGSRFLCEGKMFEPVGINQTGQIWVSTGAGDDSIYALAYNSRPTSANLNNAIRINAGSGNDFIDMGSDQAFFNLLPQAPAFGLIYGGSGNDIISSTGEDFSNSSGNFGYDRCEGDGGNDIVYCTRSNDSTCFPRSGSGDICSQDCGSFLGCEVIDPYSSLGCSPADEDCVEDLWD